MSCHVEIGEPDLKNNELLQTGKFDIFFLLSDLTAIPCVDLQGSSFL
jgi:hypothetical protein